MVGSDVIFGLMSKPIHVHLIALDRTVYTMLMFADSRISVLGMISHAPPPPPPSHRLPTRRTSPLAHAREYHTTGPKKRGHVSMTMRMDLVLQTNSSAAVRHKHVRSHNGLSNRRKELSIPMLFHIPIHMKLHNIFFMIHQSTLRNF